MPGVTCATQIRFRRCTSAAFAMLPTRRPCAMETGVSSGDHAMPELMTVPPKRALSVDECASTTSTMPG